MFAVFAAAGVLASCDSGLAWSEIEEPEVSGNPALDTEYTPIDFKSIEVKFVVCNGGWGLTKSEGIVSTADDSKLLYKSASWAEDFCIGIPVAKADSYVNIRWQCTDALSRKFWVKGKMPVKATGRYAVVLDFNEEENTDGWDIDTQNLDEVYKYGPGGAQKWLPADWDEAKSKSVDYTGTGKIIYGIADGEDDYADDAVASGVQASGTIEKIGSAKATKTIKVKFIVKNGGGGLINSRGIVSSQEDKCAVYDYDDFANDFHITVTVPASDRYLNIRWKAYELWGLQTFVKAKMVVAADGNYSITLDYNDGGEVATDNLYDVTSATLDGSELGKSFEKDFYAAWRAATEEKGSDSKK